MVTSLLPLIIVQRCWQHCCHFTMAAGNVATINITFVHVRHTHIYGGLLVILFRLRCLCAALDILLYAKKVNEYVVDEINEL